MQTLIHGGRRYLPILTRNKLLDARAMVSYGPAGSGRFTLTVYLLCKYEGAGSRGGTQVQHFDIPAYREHVDNCISEAEQEQRLEFMLNIVAVRQDCDYQLRLGISTKKTPAGRTGRKRLLELKTQPMSVIFDEYERELQEKK